MKLATVVCCFLALGSIEAKAVTFCEDKAGDQAKAHWTWRIIDNKRCWYKSPRLPKSELMWERIEKITPPKIEPEVKPSPLPIEASKPAVKVLPSRATWPPKDSTLSEDTVDLLQDSELNGRGGVGDKLAVPPYVDFEALHAHARMLAEQAVARQAEEAKARAKPVVEDQPSLQAESVQKTAQSLTLNDIVILLAIFAVFAVFAAVSALILSFFKRYIGY